MLTSGLSRWFVYTATHSVAQWQSIRFSERGWGGGRDGGEEQGIWQSCQLSTIATSTATHENESINRSCIHCDCLFT